MATPNYILKTTEDIDVLKNPGERKIKKAILIILIVIIVASFIFGENLFGELNFMAKIILLGLVFGVLFVNKKETKQFPLELRFYEDKIEVIRHEVHYSNGDVKQEFYVFPFDGNPSCTYAERSRLTRIRGMAHGEWYKYTKDGFIAEKPERVRDMQGICYFNLSQSADVNLPNILKQYTPIKVDIEK